MDNNLHFTFGHVPLDLLQSALNSLGGAVVTRWITNPGMARSTPRASAVFWMIVLTVSNPFVYIQ